MKVKLKQKLQQVIRMNLFSIDWPWRILLVFHQSAQGRPISQRGGLSLRLPQTHTVYRMNPRWKNKRN